VNLRAAEQPLAEHPLVEQQLVDHIVEIDISSTQDQDESCQDKSCQGEPCQAVELKAPQDSEEEITKAILRGFFKDNGHEIRKRLEPVMYHHIREESEEVRIVLAEGTLRSIGTPVVNADDSLSDKIFSLLSTALEDLITQEERKSEELQQEVKSRWPRVKVFIVSGVTSLIGIAIGAALGASIEYALTE
jgi:hypothetical protein